ncbi:hypothetical protein COK29_34065, partial [Bacillus cereus]
FKDVKKLYDVKLEPKMNFTIKINTLYDGAERGDLTNNEIGTWSGAKLNLELKPNTGKYVYCLQGTAKVTLSSTARQKLKPNAKYYLSFYSQRALSSTEEKLPVQIHDVNGKEIKSEVVKVQKGVYQKYNILIPNKKESEIGSVTFNASNQFYT